MIILPNPFDFNSADILPDAAESGSATPTPLDAEPVALTSITLEEIEEIALIRARQPSTDHIHEIFHHASKLIADDYRDWALTREDDDLYESLKAADQAATRDLPHQDERALLDAIELMPRFLRLA